MLSAAAPAQAFPDGFFPHDFPSFFLFAFIE